MRILRSVAIPLLIVLVGVGVALVVVRMQPKAERETPPRTPPLVDVVEAVSGAATAVVEATGEVGPSETVTITPEVRGKISYRAEALVPGGRLAKGDLMVRIDPREYELAIREQESQVRQVRLDLEMEESRKSVAEREWELLGDDRPAEEAALALRGPQLEAARENLEAAQSTLDRARLDLERTQIRAPFNALVVSASADAGQVVQVGSVLATIIGTDRFWVDVSVPVEQLAVIEVPGFNADRGSPVEVVHELGGAEPVVREGRVFGLAGGLDPATRTARLLVAVDDPLDPPDGRQPLLHGAFVKVRIRGRELAATFTVPAIALVEGSTIWTVAGEDRLRARTVRVGWSDRDTVVVTDGLEEGDRVVTTPLALPVEGMKVEVRDGGREGSDRPDAEHADD